MKSFLILIAFVFLTAIATSFVLAVPVESNHERTLRTRRDISGVFDSIANGFESLVKGARKVSDSVFVAFNAVFSTDNKNALTDGFEKFGNGLRGAVTGMFGINGEKVKNGLNKVGEKIKGAWNGNDGSTPAQGSPASDNGSSNNADPSSQPQPKESPDGQVPEEETT